MKYFLFFFLSISTHAFPQNLKMHHELISLKKGLKFTLEIPENYHITVAAEGLERPRFFAKSPDGRLFITDMWSKSDNKMGRILILDGWDEKEKKFTKIHTYLNHLHNPNQVAFYTVNGKHFLYVAETGRLSYYEFKFGDTIPSAAPKQIAVFPEYGSDYKYGGWHLTRSIAFKENKLYVSVGSSCNACIEKEEVRASIIEMNPDGSNQKVFVRGLRNSVGMKWIGKELWVTSMGRDLIGPDKPEDLFHTVKANEYYGWPFYYQYRKKIYADAQFKDSIKSSFIKMPPLASWGFKAHSAPLGFDYFTNFSDTLLNHTFLVALHGSTSVWRQRGNAIVQLLPNGIYKDFVSGFLQGKTESKRYGRPCDIIQWNASSFFVSDDKHGVVYFVWKK